MGTAYYYSRDSERFGPVSVEQIREMAASGQLLPTDLIWKEGMADWVPAARLKGLFPVVAAAAQPEAAPQPVAAVQPHADHADEFRVAELPPRPAAVEEPHRSAQDERAAAVEADQAADMGRKAKEAALAAGNDALTAMKHLAANPVGGLRSSFEALGESRAMAVGIVFGVVFDLCILIGGRLLLGSLLGGFAGMPEGMPTIPNMPNMQIHTEFHVSVTFGDYIKLFILGLVPPLCATGGCALARTVFKGRGNIQSDIFIAGSALLPFGLAVLLAGILGAGNYQISSVLMVFAMTTGVLMLYSGCTKLQEIPEAAATLAVPLMIIVDLFACQVIWRMM